MKREKLSDWQMVAIEQAVEAYLPSLDPACGAKLLNTLSAATSIAIGYEKRKIKINVSTRQYEASHMKKPRGLGSWAFQIGSDDEPFWAHQSTYNDAVKKAKQQARELGVEDIEVLP